MASLREYFDTDFTYILSVHKEQILHITGSTLGIPVVVRVHLDFNSNTKFLSYYVPQSELKLNDLCRGLIMSPEQGLKLADGVAVMAGFVGEEKSPSTELKFSGRVFLYLEGQLTTDQETALKQLAVSRGLSLRIRSQKFAKERSKLEKPLAFISHDARNKEEIARPVAIELSKMMCPVWFDEFTLRVGDSLRESIERGLKTCKKCILVLTPEFLSNEGWTKREFDSVFTREILTKQKVVLPIWHRISVNDVYQYSPSLADRVGVKWTLGVKEVARRLYRAIIKDTEH